MFKTVSDDDFIYCILGIPKFLGEHIKIELIQVAPDYKGNQYISLCVHLLKLSGL